MKALIFCALTALTLLSGESSANMTPDEIKAECAKTNSDPVGCFRLKESMHIFECELTVGLELRKGGSDMSCVLEADSKIKPYYDNAIKSLAKKPKQAEMLKDYFAYWQGTVAALIPDMNQTRADYQRVLSERKRVLGDKARRLNLEK